jgi:hypothetical protein
MQVKDLSEIVEQASPKYAYASFNNLEYTPGSLKVKGTDIELTLGEQGMKKFSVFLGIPKAFLPKLNNDLQTSVVNYFLEKDAVTEALIGYSNDGMFKAAYPGNTPFLRNELIANAIERTFDPESRIRAIDFNNGIDISVVTEELNTEPRVNDVTHGGLKISARIGEAPIISTYLERLVCSNGMVVPSLNSTLSLRGRTVDEIIAEMEHMANMVLSTEVDDALAKWSQTAQVPVNDAALLIHRFCREYGLGSRMESKLLERIDELEGNTYYDVINLITSMQHEIGVSENMRHALQLAGGNLVNAVEIHRCNTCQHPLDV